MIAQRCRSSFVGIVFFLLCIRLVYYCVSDLFVFFGSVCVYFAVMFVFFVENANSFSLEPIACALSDCTKFIIESVMVDVCPWWSEVLWETFDFSSIDL
jgi:hypothetical protein